MTFRALDLTRAREESTYMYSVLLDDGSSFSTCPKNIHQVAVKGNYRRLQDTCNEAVHTCNSNLRL